MADKPECKYGAKCYRKSEDHLRRFKHPGRKINDEIEAEEEDIGDDELLQLQEDVTSRPSKRQKMTEEVEEDIDEEQDNLPSRTEEVDSEEISENENEEQSSDADEKPDTPPNIDIREELRLKFKVEMPQDFFDFWDYCKSVNHANPSEALKEDVGLVLGGPYDIMAGRLKCVKGQRPNYVLHHRFFYDPPEFQTVLVGDEKKQHHLGYYRDEPQKAPVFIASNSAKEGCTITPQGENIFAAVKLHMDKLAKQTKDKTKLGNLKKRDKSLTEWAKKCNYSLEARTKNMKARDKKMVTKTFHKAGIVVPLDSSGVGYRELPETDEMYLDRFQDEQDEAKGLEDTTKRVIEQFRKRSTFSTQTGDLKRILQRIVDSETEQEKARYSDSLQEIITFIQFANDECDYGQGYELGLDLFSFGHERFHSMIGMLLSVAYQLLGREVFGEILDAHLKERERDNVSKIL